VCQARAATRASRAIVFSDISVAFSPSQEQAAADAEIAKNAADAEKSLEARDAAELETMDGIISNEGSAEVLQDSVLEYLKTKTGASAAYLGVCGTKTETVGEGDEAAEVSSEVLNYVATTSNQKFLLGQSLVKPAEDAKDQKGALSFGIFEREDATPPEPADGEEPPVAPEGGWGTRWVTPYLKVAECVRNDKVKYFRTPKLGGYLTIPYEYSYEEDTMNEGDGPDLVDGSCPPYPEFTTETKALRGSVSLDTLGTDGEFNDADCATAVAWVAKLAEGLGRVATDKVSGERALRSEITVNNEEQWTSLEVARKELEGALPALLEESKAAAAALRAEGVAAPVEGEEPAAVPEETEAEVALREGTIRLAKLTERITASIESIATLAERVDQPSRHWGVLQALLNFLQVPEGDCDSWDKCKAYVATDEFKATIEKVDVTVAKDVLVCQSSAAVAAALEGTDGKNVERTHVPISSLLEWLSQALAVHDAAVEVRKAKKAAVEATGSEYTEQVEDNVTDKPDEEVAPPADE